MVLHLVSSTHPTQRGPFSPQCCPSVDQISAANLDRTPVRPRLRFRDPAPRSRRGAAAASLGGRPDGRPGSLALGCVTSHRGFPEKRSFPLSFHSTYTRRATRTGAESGHDLYASTSTKGVKKVRAAPEASRRITPHPVGRKALRTKDRRRGRASSREVKEVAKGLVG